MDHRIPVDEAVLAADPRVVEVRNAGWTYSGFARNLTFTVVIEGEEPLSTETVSRILIAALDAAPVRTDFIALRARSAANPDKRFDLSIPAEGFPAGVSFTINGTQLYMSDSQIEALRGGK